MTLRANMMRQILMEEQFKIDAEIQEAQEASNKTLQQVLAEDPFLAGRAYSIAAVSMKIFIATEEANERRKHEPV